MNKVKSFRELCGPHDPEIARNLRPNTIRARFGVDRVKNAVHCTDLPEDGILEVILVINNKIRWNISSTFCSKNDLNTKKLIYIK